MFSLGRLHRFTCKTFQTLLEHDDETNSSTLEDTESTIQNGIEVAVNANIMDCNEIPAETNVSESSMIITILFIGEVLKATQSSRAAIASYVERFALVALVVLEFLLRDFGFSAL